MNLVKDKEWYLLYKFPLSPFPGYSVPLRCRANNDICLVNQTKISLQGTRKHSYVESNFITKSFLPTGAYCLNEALNWSNVDNFTKFFFLNLSKYGQLSTSYSFLSVMHANQNRIITVVNFIEYLSLNCWEGFNSIRLVQSFSFFKVKFFDKFGIKVL